VKQDNGFGLWVWGVMEVVNVAIWAKAANDEGTRWGGDDVPLVADGDFAVVPEADAGLLAPDVGPPRALGAGRRTERFSARACWWAA